MSIVIHNCEQGSPEWLKARAGMPTASAFDSVLAMKMRRTYLLTLAGERITGEIAPTYQNAHMARGKAFEDDARNLYEFQTDTKVTRVGFITNTTWRAGVSPDSLIGKKGGLEIKSKLPHLQLECLESNVLPAEHVAQCQGFLAITERSWIDFVSYWPGLPLFVKRVKRDEAYIARLRLALRSFNRELDAMVKKYSATASPASARHHSTIAIRKAA